MSKKEVQLSEWKDNPNNDGAFRADENGKVLCALKERNGVIEILYANEVGELTTHTEVVPFSSENKHMDAALKAMRICENLLAINYNFRPDVEGYRNRIIEEIINEGEDPAEHFSIAA